MWTTAVFRFRLSDHDFRRLTTRQFWKIWEQYQESFKRECYLAGIVAATVCNVNRTSANQRIFEPWDWVPRSVEEQQKEEIMLMFRKTLSQTPPDPVFMEGTKRSIEKKIREIRPKDAEEVIAAVFA